MTHALAATTSSAGQTALGLLVWLAFALLYFIPAIVAIARRGQANTGSVIVVNFFLGWTVIGWIVALAMACRTSPRTRLQWPEWSPPYQGPEPGQSPRPPAGPPGSYS